MSAIEITTEAGYKTVIKDPVIDSTTGHVTIRRGPYEGDGSGSIVCRLDEVQSAGPHDARRAEVQREIADLQNRIDRLRRECT
jgi:hypothetical protein